MTLRGRYIGEDCLPYDRACLCTFLKEKKNMPRHIDLKQTKTTASMQNLIKRSPHAKIKKKNTCLADKELHLLLYYKLQNDLVKW